MDGLEEEWAGKVRVLQVSIGDAQSRAFTRQLDAQFTPTFILFDATGREVWRMVGQIDTDEVRQQVALLQSE